MTLQELQLQLQRFVPQIEALANQIQQKRHEVTIAEAQFIDARTRAEDDIFSGRENIRMSLVSHYIHSKTAEKEKTFKGLKSQLQDLETQKSIIMEVNNTLKLSARMMMHEIENLPFS